MGFDGQQVPNNITPIVPDPWALGKSNFDPDRRTYRKTAKEHTEMVTFRLPFSIKEEIKKLLDGSKLAHIHIESYSDFMIDAAVLQLERIEELNIVGQHYHSRTRRMVRQQQLIQEREEFLETASNTLDMVRNDIHGLDELLETLLLEKSHLTNEPQSHIDQLDHLIKQVRGLLDPQ